VRLWLALVRCGGGYGAPGEGFSCDGLVLRQISRFLSKSVHDRGFPGFLVFVTSWCRLLWEKARDEERVFRACEEILRGSGRSVSKDR
jgi:hypothetical protein